MTPRPLSRQLLRLLVRGLEAICRHTAVLAQMYVAVPPAGEVWLTGRPAREQDPPAPEQDLPAPEQDLPAREQDLPAREQGLPAREQCPPIRHGAPSIVGVPSWHPERPAGHRPLSTVEMHLWSQVLGADRVRSIPRQPLRGTPGDRGTG